MSIVVLLSTMKLGWIILRDTVTPPVIVLDIDELRNETKKGKNSPVLFCAGRAGTALV